MKQAVQNLNTGKTDIVEVPAPLPGPGIVLVRTAASLVSVGTERTVVEFAGRSLVGKARSRPDLVRQVIQKGQREGWVTAVEAAFSRLRQPMALGYSSAGVVTAIGTGVRGFRPGDRVACAGGGHAVHAEFVTVPVNLLARVPDGVELDDAAFATLGAIALHGFRLSGAALGDNVAVIGLGLVGLLAAQIAAAAGCRVFGVDTDPARVRLAAGLGLTAAARGAAEARGGAFTGGRGFDAVLVCADTPSADPLALAGALARDRGTVIAVGAVGMSMPRKPYYEKEIDFRVSRSYGPGRYDPAYEEAGTDYPYGFVRWTEQRNLEAFLELLASGKVRTDTLITHRFPIERAADAYRLISQKAKSAVFLGVLLSYPGDSRPDHALALRPVRESAGQKETHVRLGVLGAGNFASMVALPIVAKLPDVEKAVIASAGGLSAREAAARFGFARASADSAAVIADPSINAVGIYTRHNLHASQTTAALKAGKHVFCEKPLAFNEDELRAVERAVRQNPDCVLTVGFNRRFAPMVLRMRQFIAEAGSPPILTIRVNAGPMPASHWTMDPAVGGGRILGEACHFVDLMTYLAGALPVRVGAAGIGDAEDNFAAVFEFQNGATGTLVYSSAGDKSFAKERFEAFAGGGVAVLDDFRRLETRRDGRGREWKSRWRQEKGHREIWESFLRSIRGQGPVPIAIPEIFAVTRATFALQRAVRETGIVTIRS